LGDKTQENIEMEQSKDTKTFNKNCKALNALQLYQTIKEKAKIIKYMYIKLNT